MIFILCFIFFSKLSAQTKLSSEDETLSGHLQEDHRRGDIFHYEEDKAIQDPLLLAEEYKSPSSLNDPKYLFELSLIEGGFGELNPFPPNMTSSWSYLTSSAKLGHAGALHKLASAYFTGVYGGHRIPVDIGRSIVLDQMSALAGYAPAHVSLGYKHLKGLGVKASCERAAVHYEFAANAVVNRILRRGYALQNERIHLSQLERKLNKNELSNDLLQYYHHAALDGDVLAATNLGTIYLYGTRTAPQNVSKALYYLKTGYQWGGVAAAGLLGYTLMHLHMAVTLVSFAHSLLLNS